MGTLSLVAPLVLFEKSRLWAGIGFHLLPSFHHHPAQHNHTTQTVTHSHPNLNFLQHCTDTLPTRNVVCLSGAWFENRPYSMPSIRLVRNPKRIIVQWVGIRTHTHTHITNHWTLTKLRYQWAELGFFGFSDKCETCLRVVGGNNFIFNVIYKWKTTVILSRILAIFLHFREILNIRNKNEIYCF